jgi:uncharacterized protein with HEPN domain
MKNREKDLVRLKHIFDAVDLLEKFSEDLNFDQFKNDLMAQSAMIRQFEVIGEASANRSSEMKNNHPNIKWDLLKDYRNLLIHEYFRIDIIGIWGTVKNDLSILKEQIESLISITEKELHEENS